VIALFDHLILVGKHQSDNINSLMIGPFVDGLVRMFGDIDYVRREGGFDVPYRPHREKGE
jgi:hypothetical protein